MVEKIKQTKDAFENFWYSLNTIWFTNHAKDNIDSICTGIRSPHFSPPFSINFDDVTNKTYRNIHDSIRLMTNKEPVSISEFMSDYGKCRVLRISFKDGTVEDIEYDTWLIVQGGMMLERVKAKIRSQLMRHLPYADRKYREIFEKV